MTKWTKDTGKPYIRRANGKERATTLRNAMRLAIYRELYGRSGFYVLVQRHSGPEVMSVGRTRDDIIGSLLSVRKPSDFNRWANRIKRMAQNP
jgi:hypothetical protein